MAHIKNADFYLYTGLTANGNDCYEALKFLNDSGIQFIHLHYGDPAQHEEVLHNVGTWFQGQDVTIDFPFVHYNEVIDIDPYKTVKAIVGIDAIKSTDWVSLFNFTNTPSGG